MTTRGARFMATHVAPRLTAAEEADLANRLEMPEDVPAVVERLTALVPTVSAADVEQLDKDMYVRDITLGDHQARVSVENTLLKYQLYDTRTNRPVRLHIRIVSRRLSRIGYRRYENQFSKLAIRTSAPLRGTISLHNSGKLLVTGTANIDVARFLTCTYVPHVLLPALGVLHLEARDEVLSNIVVKMETPYTFSPHLMAKLEEDVTYEPARFSSAMLKNEGTAGASSGPADPRLVAVRLRHRFLEPALPTRRWAILFFKPNRVLFVGLTSMDDVEPMARMADAIAFPYRYELPKNRLEEDELAATYNKKRTRKRPRVQDAPPEDKTSTRKRPRVQDAPPEDR